MKGLGRYSVHLKFSLSKVLAKLTIRQHPAHIQTPVFCDNSKIREAKLEKRKLLYEKIMKDWPPNWASNWRTFFSNSVAWARASCACVPSNHFFHTVNKPDRKSHKFRWGWSLRRNRNRGQGRCRGSHWRCSRWQFIGDFGYCNEGHYLAKTSERDGSKKVDVELKIAWGRITFNQSQILRKWCKWIGEDLC